MEDMNKVYDHSATISYAKRYCKEDISLIENYTAMLADTTQKWCCHHRREIDEHKSRQQLIDECNYYKRPAVELIFLTDSEHKSLHSKGNTNMLGKHHAEATIKKMSDSKKGNKYGVGNHKPKSNEHKENISAAMKGKNLGCHWFNNGIKQVFCKVCPSGFIAGRLQKGAIV